jgi:phosphoglycolate phosphatase
LKVKPIDCVYVGDSVIDIEAARNAGMRVIAVPSGIYSEKELLRAKPTELIKNLRGILKLMN